MRYVAKYIKKRRLKKFLEEGLYLSNLGQFEDAFEAILPYAQSSASIDLNQAREAVNFYFDRAKVCCFTDAESESYAMWHIYAEREGGVMFVLDVATVLSILQVKQVWCADGEVTYDPRAVTTYSYMDHGEPDDDFRRYLDLLFRKHKSYSFEKEYRIVMDSDKYNARYIPNNYLLDAVKSVTFSPYSSEKIIGKQTKELKKVYPDIDYRNSSLRFRPD